MGFTHAITWADFWAKLESLGVAVKGGPKGCAYLERAVNGTIHWASVQKDRDPNDHVSPTVIRSVCANLQIDPKKHFGLTLDFHP